MLAVTKRKRRPLGRRIARIAGITLGAVVTLVLLLLAFLQTPWGKGVVRGRIEAKLAAMVNGQVSLGSVDYSFLFREIELGELQIRDAHGAPAIGLGSLHVTLDRGSLLAGAPVIEELALGGVDVNLVKAADGTSNLQGLFKPSKRRPLASIRVEQLSVTGAATITNPNGTVIAVRDLHLGGSLAARPVAKELDLALRDLGAVATITPRGAQAREVTLRIASITAGRRAGGLDLDVERVAAGALGIDAIGAHLRLDGERLVGNQDIRMTGVTLDDAKLEQLLGRELLAADAKADITITGPARALVVDGTVATGGARLALDGTLDLSRPERPRYRVALTGAGLRSDVVASAKERPLVESTLAIHVEGEGAARGDIDATLGIAVGPTKIGKLALNGLFVSATAHHGALSLDILQASAPGVAIDARGKLSADRQVTGRVRVHGTPAEVAAALAEAGLVLPARVPLPPRVDLAVTATGDLDGELAVVLEPAQLRVAGGQVAIAGSAKLVQQQLQHASTTVDLRRLDLAALARLAGKQPKVTGSLSGTLDVVRTATTKQVTYDLALGLDKLGLSVSAKGTAQESRVTAKVTAARTRDRAIVATMAASVPLVKRHGKRALSTTGALALDIDIAKRSLADVAELLPARLRGELPAGDVEVHADIAGTAARPTGMIDVAVTARKLKEQQQRVVLRADLASSARGLAVTTRGQVWLRDEVTPIATLAGTVTTASPVAGGKLDLEVLRASAAVDAVIELPERELASLAFLRDKLATLGGKLDGRIAVKGPLAAPALDATIAVHDVPTAAGTRGRTTLTARGTPKALTATIAHGEGITITAAIDRSAKDRIAIALAAAATRAPLLSALPAFLAPKVGAHQIGALDWDMTGKLALVRGANGGLAVETAAVTGTLDVKGGAFAVPNTTRRWHDIDLSIASEPGGLRITSLALHEQDRQHADRAITASGFVALERFVPQRVDLSLAAKDWLLSGTPLLGKHDAPRATATFDLGVTADLRAPVLAVDATVKRFELRLPDRQDRGHQFELASVGGDIIYVDASAPAGKLPVAVRPAPAAPRKRRAMDVRIHIPNAIRVEQAPIDVMARGELAVTVRDEGVTTRGGLVVERGQINLMGKAYEVTQGSFEFSDAHPQGNLAVTFEHPLPPAVMRQLSIASAGGGATFTLSGSPSNPVKALGGASNAGLQDAMSINGRGNPQFTSAPDLPASTTVVAPRGDGLGVISFMASNLPHLLVLDRVNAYSDQYQSAAAYGRIQHAELERYSVDQKARVRAVVRPPTPGRSSAEVQVDRLFVNTNRTAVGVGVRAGDRAGGGVGLFVEWSSD